MFFLVTQELIFAQNMWLSKVPYLFEQLYMTFLFSVCFSKKNFFEHLHIWLMINLHVGLNIYTWHCDFSSATYITSHFYWPLLVFATSCDSYRIRSVTLHLHFIYIYCLARFSHLTQFLVLHFLPTYLFTISLIVVLAAFILWVGAVFYYIPFIP